MNENRVNARLVSRVAPGVAYGAVALVSIMGIWLLGQKGIAADEPALAPAAKILDQFVEVTGGREAHLRIMNRVRQERAIHTDMDFEDKMTVYTAAPDKQYTEIDSDAFGTIESGSDGDVVWYLSDQTGPVVQQGAARTAGLLGATFNAALRWRELFERAEYLGEALVDGKPADKVVLTPREGAPNTCYFDHDSHLLVKVERTRLFAQMPPIPVEARFSDYRWVDGVLIPHKVTQVSQQCGAKREIVFVTDKIEHNVEIAPDRFTPPKEIQTLAAQMAGTQDGAATAGQGGCCGSGGGAKAGDSGAAGAAATTSQGGCCGGGGAKAGGGGAGCGGGAKTGGGGAGCGGGAKAVGAGGAGCGGAKAPEPPNKQTPATTPCGGGS